MLLLAGIQPVEHLAQFLLVRVSNRTDHFLLDVVRLLVDEILQRLELQLLHASIHRVQIGAVASRRHYTALGLFKHVFESLWLATLPLDLFHVADHSRQFSRFFLQRVHLLLSLQLRQLSLEIL